MKNNSQKGFSLIELLIVVVIIGILAAISVAFFHRARVGAENRAAIAQLSTIRSAQANYYAQKNRFATLPELQQSQNGSMAGTLNSDGTLHKGKFTFAVTSTGTELPTRYLVVATRDSDTLIPYIFTLDHTGIIDGVDQF